MYKNIKENKCPCVLECSERSETCHGKCKKYLKWRKEHLDREKKVRMKKWLESL